MDRARHTTIIADCWKGYNHDVLTTEGFNHLTFLNHSLNFVDPDSGTHTNTIESTWRHIKSRFPQYNRMRIRSEKNPQVYTGVRSAMQWSRS
ncbi:hypothetical protein TNCV_421851 [Trichonephila clavipes]|nr:hypothetical protein TNCV_421851 [Trichonephila clavipes]